MKNPGNFEAHLVFRPGVFQVQQQRIFNNSFLMMDKIDSYVILQAFSLQPYSFILFYSFKSMLCCLFSILLNCMFCYQVVSKRQFETSGSYL